MSFLTALLALVATGAATQVHYENVSFEDLVRQSQVIVVVRRAEPGTRDVKIPITGPAGPYPDYGYQLDRLVVVEVIKGSGVKPGVTVELGPATAADDLHLHRSYYVEQIGKSPIYFSYESSLGWDKKPETWLEFMHPCRVEAEDHFCRTLTGAREDIARRGDVEKLLAKPSGD